MVAFEAVARTGSVTGAADELGVTHSAVSKQLSVLEAWLGVPLFASNRRQMLPTAAAAQLATATGAAFDLMASAIETMAPQAAPEVLRVIAPATFAMRWLIPRLPTFQAQIGQAQASDVDVLVRPTHTTENWADIPFDVVIRRGDALPSDLRVVSLFREEITLVARADVLGDRAKDGPSRLVGGRLLEAVTRPGELSRWLVAAGLPPDHAARATRFGHFYIALEAALAGQGLLAAPIEVVADLLARGELVEPFPDLRIAGPDYRLGYDSTGPHALLAAAFADWLSNEALMR
jgi:DNA-binding transcriptional LysR family regulator